MHADFITLGCLATSFISSLASEIKTGTTCELSRAVYLGAIGSMTYTGRARERGTNDSLDKSPHKTTKASLLSHCSEWWTDQLMKQDEQGQVEKSDMKSRGSQT